MIKTICECMWRVWITATVYVSATGVLFLLGREVSEPMAVFGGIVWTSISLVKPILDYYQKSKSNSL